ncbi:MAG: TRAM domain-containing protein [Candidatus ainarchaeum sp.]|nr:TRAM domain-containing protein [Candidatus ainarchaeum sp.]MDD5096395.1 TRAM domain-containing protein [Candidatus ainarchaeum sp.]
MDEEKKSFELPKPVKDGDILEVTIESVGGKGDGMAKKDGFVIFVPNAQKGETIKVRITSLKRTFGIGERVEE